LQHHAGLSIGSVEVEE